MILVIQIFMNPNPIYEDGTDRHLARTGRVEAIGATRVEAMINLAKKLDEAGWPDDGVSECR